MSIHISEKPGEIADKILIPGDPLRAKFIAENFLDDAVCFNEVRTM
ncbi:purine-nucleoside phosphorylase, partial [Streptococcus suis]